MLAEDLFQQALNGDAAAYVGLLDLLEQPMYAYFRRRQITAEEAEDLTQQVFLALLTRPEAFDARRGSLRGYLFGIARRLWLKSAGKSTQPAVELEADTVDEWTPSPETMADRAEQVARLESAIESLPDVPREVLTLRVQQCLSIAEIAGVMSLPENTVKSHLFRARARLRDELEAEMNERSGD
jgi:RNA polymerase sigma-70 factor (ECF subfamily)